MITHTWGPHTPVIEGAIYRDEWIDTWAKWKGCVFYNCDFSNVGATFENCKLVRCTGVSENDRVRWSTNNQIIDVGVCVWFSGSDLTHHCENCR